jgi:hypothetical protein
MDMAPFFFGRVQNTLKQCKNPVKVSPSHYHAMKMVLLGLSQVSVFPRIQEPVAREPEVLSVSASRRVDASCLKLHIRLS